MAVTVVDLIQDGSVVGTVIADYNVVDVVNTAPVAVVNNISQPVTEITGTSIIANVVVSATPPVNPYEGQIWIDIS